MISRRSLALLLISAIAAFSSLPAPARTCPPNVVAAPKGSTLYLYYPTVVDTQFPLWGIVGFPSNPLGAFDPSQLDPSIGPQPSLMARVQTMVQTGLCEFDIGVTSVTTMPVPTQPRWQIAGIGSDTVSGQTPGGGKPLGGAQRDDYNDANAQDYARLWIGELQQWAGAELQPATQERWATAIANLLLHETSHNYGTTHTDALPRTGEDPSWTHFMADPSLGATPARMAAGLNHHSDASYEMMAHSVGLAAQTVTNWDFINPNSTTADRLVITLVALGPPSQANLSNGWVYTGPLSPWSNAVLAQIPDVTFRGVLHAGYELHFYGAKPWNNGPTGMVPSDALFHAGASINGGAYVVLGARLEYNSLALDLHPRMVDFAGTTGFKPAGGNAPGFSLTLSNPDPARGPLLVRDVDIQFSPRMIDIETMMAGAVPRGLDDRPAALYTRTPTKAQPNIPRRAALRRRGFMLGRDPVVIPVAALTDRRHVMTPQAGCGRQPPRLPLAQRGPGRFDSDGECSTATALSMFPATFVYVTATIVDPRARHWDQRRRRMVEGPIATRVFFQVAGTVPDANDNGIDDLLDILEGRSRDSNQDGVPDETVPPRVKTAGRR